MRIDGSNISSRLNNTSLSTPNQPANVGTVGQQMTQALFGRPPPTVLNPALFPDLAVFLKSLNRFRRKCAALAEDEDEDYVMVLADSATAAIDKDGVIYLGASFLAQNASRPEVVIGAIAHEIGHQPRKWAGIDGAGQETLSAAKLDEMCQVEETKADLFAGEAMAELGLSCEPLIDYLTEHEDGPHRRYLPAADRAEIIRQAYRGRAKTMKSRRQLYPDYERHRAARGYIRKV